MVQEPKQRAQAETWEIPSECQKKAFSFGEGGGGGAVAGCQGAAEPLCWGMWSPGGLRCPGWAGAGAGGSCVRSCALLLPLCCGVTGCVLFPGFENTA